MLKPEKELTENKVIDRLVDIRHKIFHFLDINNPQRNISYDNQERYRKDILALQDIVWHAMQERHKDIFKHK